MRKVYEIELDKKHKLRLGTNEIAALEETLGRPITSLVQVGADGKRILNFGIRELRAILWAGLLREARDEERMPYTLDDVGDLIDDAPNYGELSRTLGMALGEALGGPAKNAPAANPTP